MKWCKCIKNKTWIIPDRPFDNCIKLYSGDRVMKFEKDINYKSE